MGFKSDSDIHSLPLFASLQTVCENYTILIIKLFWSPWCIITWFIVWLQCFWFTWKSSLKVLGMNSSYLPSLPPPHSSRILILKVVWSGKLYDFDTERRRRRETEIYEQHQMLFSFSAFSHCNNSFHCNCQKHVNCKRSGTRELVLLSIDRCHLKFEFVNTN